MESCENEKNDITSVSINLMIEPPYTKTVTKYIKDLSDMAF